MHRLYHTLLPWAKKRHGEGLIHRVSYSLPLKKKSLVDFVFAVEQSLYTESIYYSHWLIKSRLTNSWAEEIKWESQSKRILGKRRAESEKSRADEEEAT